ncbi:hypothetical protein NDU88_010842 [Pleurodeles waltl]|uniref:Secreted protein n=1 Tax=Pleurodeles waltl TaxID=8319 RepID=A0AAV7QZZ0_PLEWA|nr:hypothetical protein NDU88_010842 [Pleurodeles waltl]
MASWGTSRWVQEMAGGCWVFVVLCRVVRVGRAPACLLVRVGGAATDRGPRRMAPRAPVTLCGCEAVRERERAKTGCAVACSGMRKPLPKAASELCC